MKNKKGFTLLEVIVTVLIIAVLATISGPVYNGYVHGVQKAEGYTLIGTILSAQQTYYDSNGNYLSPNHSSAGKDMWTCNDEVLGIDARNCKYYTWFSINQTFSGAYYGKVYLWARVQNKDGSTIGMRYERSNGGATYL